MVPGGFSGEKNSKGYIFGSVYNILLGLMKICGIKAVQVGMSYDSLGPRYLSVLKTRAKLFYRHSPRDSISANYLTKKKLRHNEVIPDLAFNSLPIESELEVKASEKETIFFSFRVDSSSTNKTLIENCIQQIIFSFDDQAKFIFVSQVERDNDFARECYERYNKQGIECELLINNTNIVSLLSRYQECSHVFSNRLHCLLLAARFGAFTVPVLSADANLKIQGIWKDIGHSENIFFLNQEKHNTSLASVINNSQIDFHKHRQSLIASFDEIFN
jgi:polysaccharide pyruvyl transferase WcaK-like protein